MPLNAVTRNSQALTASSQGGLLRSIDLPPVGGFDLPPLDVIPGGEIIGKKAVGLGLGLLPSFDIKTVVIRLAIGITGVALVAIGANMLVKKSEFADSAKSIATLVATKGAA